jgi:hypothetical protein
MFQSLFILVIVTLLLLFVLGKQDNLKMMKRFETILQLAVSCEELERMKITSEFQHFPKSPEFPDEKRTTLEALSIFLSSNEGILIMTLTATNCLFLTSTIFLALLRKAKQGGENIENIELQQMLPLPAEEIPAPQDQQAQDPQDPPALAEPEN